jgi:lipoate-protein ligase A
MDLEAALKDSKAEEQVVREIVENCFARSRAQTPGLLAEDFSRAIIDAIQKNYYVTLGVRPEELNFVFSVGVPSVNYWNNVSMEDISALLLPYCAKCPSCAYRNQEGCDGCGKCDMGEAFSLAREYDLEPVSVQNYEMLEDTLKGLKNRGSVAFVGFCCEAFMAKHRDDFERIGLPGILIDVDNSTCYDLGKEQEAHQGHFENQTRLKLDLLKRILAHLKRSTIEKE